MSGKKKRLMLQSPLLIPRPSSLVTLKVDARHPDQAAIRKACSILKEGGLVAFPTETFYGLGADTLNEQALKRVFALKHRGYAKPLLVIIAEKDQLHSLVSDIPAVAEKLMDSFWPGPLTIIFKAKKGLPSLLTGGTDTVGIRISSHPVARSIALTFGLPFTATSANLSGGKDPITAQDVCNQLGEGVDLILDAGETKGIKGSTIIDVTLSPPRIVREGDVPVSEIKRMLSL
ncbi:MAG: L-threonylcarbamoyladenylate synthase [Desulfovibrionales bacterium]|nr:L-threonylcarbamoyladenylate synthase [Desulfovibrionales bacterium]